ncbi:MAG: UDP binding domain-containing protein [Methanoregula sp.]|nr:UDP binding domain-containing protein [Methanoregula sp.]
MGLTYKEDVPDTRESPVEEIIHELREFKIDVYGYDPLLPAEVIERFGAKPVSNPDMKVDAVIIAVAHKQFKEMPANEILKMMNGSGPRLCKRIYRPEND